MNSETSNSFDKVDGLVDFLFAQVSAAINTGSHGQFVKTDVFGLPLLRVNLRTLPGIYFGKLNLVGAQRFSQHAGRWRTVLGWVATQSGLLIADSTDNGIDGWISNPAIGIELKGNFFIQGPRGFGRTARCWATH